MSGPYPTPTFQTITVDGAATLSGGAAIADGATITGGATIDSLTASVVAANTATEPPQWQQVLAGDAATYHNVTASRSIATAYTNSQTRPIAVSVWATAPGPNAALEGIVSGTTIAYSTGAETTGAITAIYFIVPVGATYEIGYNTTAPTLTAWFEMY